MQPKMLNDFMYALMKEARRDSFREFLENWEITQEEYEEIEAWFKNKLGIKL
ncbi:hypothetical protein NY607_01735 [Lysinibacillus sp. A4]|uniref:hypothetical protein n=1 Tax=Lysinibacillus sp. A4 TaxID=2976269 RepID=UPI0021758C2A|nr:hypothetical protein [Lysinibacillus sp. A4]MCS5499824.1 hypothetical protein [Lysinibacillus sp. A4]